MTSTLTRTGAHHVLHGQESRLRYVDSESGQRKRRSLYRATAKEACDGIKKARERLLSDAHATGRLPQEFKRLRRYRLLIIDEIGGFEASSQHFCRFWRLCWHHRVE